MPSRKALVVISILLFLAVLTSCSQPSVHKGTISAINYEPDWGGGLTTVYFYDGSSVNFEGQSTLEVGKTYSLVVFPTRGGRHELLSVLPIEE